MRRRLKRLARRVGLKSRRAAVALPPDFDERTRQIFRAVADRTMTSPERIEALVSAVRYVVTNRIPGDFVECGTWRGGSAMAMSMALADSGDESRGLYLYDTFEGMSPPTDHDVSLDGQVAAEKFSATRLGADASDWCRASIEEVERNVLETGFPPSRLHLIKGKVEDTLPGQAPRGDIAILRLDTDWYASTKHELIHLYPRLISRGVLIIDDYGHWAGARRAVDEYVAENGLPLMLQRVDYTARVAIKP